AAAEPLAGLQPGLHWRAAISQTTAEKGIETLTRADPARIAFERPAVPRSVGSGFDRGMSPRFPDMASVSDPCVGERLAAPATANFECGEAGRHLDERRRLHEAAVSTLIQDGVTEHESMCANVSADVDAPTGRRRLYQSVTDTKAAPSRIGAEIGRASCRE